MGRNRQERPKGGAKEQRRSPEEQEHKKKRRMGSTPSGKWSLGHPFRERVPKRPFAGASSLQCSALSDFFTLFWAILGSF